MIKLKMGGRLSKWEVHLLIGGTAPNGLGIS